MALGTNASCSECGMKHATSRGDCAPLDQRRGPSVTDPKHPSNSGEWARYSSLPRIDSRVHGPYGGDRAK